MNRAYFLLAAFGMACSANEKSSESGIADGDVDTPPPMVTINLSILQAGGGGLAGVSLDSGWDTALTDAVGNAQINVEEGAPFVIQAELADHLPHRFQGTAGETNVDLVSFMGDNMTMGQINQQLGISSDGSKGLVVIALDRPNLSPAVGASAELDVESEQPYAIGAIGGSYTDTIGASHMGALVFANVSPGEANATASHDTLSCLTNPGQETTQSIDVKERTVNVGFFICD